MTRGPFLESPENFSGPKICETANRLFWKADLLTCFRDDKKKMSVKLDDLIINTLRSWVTNGNCDTRKWPVKFRDIRETGLKAPFVETSETFRASFGRRNSLCMSRRERFQIVNFTVMLLLVILKTCRKISLPKPADAVSQIDFGHEKVSGLSRDRPQAVKWNRPFPSSYLPPHQSESKCEVFVMVISSTLKYEWKLIFIRKTSPVDSLWRGGRHELGNGLLRLNLTTPPLPSNFSMLVSIRNLNLLHYHCTYRIYRQKGVIVLPSK